MGQKEEVAQEKVAFGKKSISSNPFGMSYYQMLRESEAQKRSLMGDDFERDGRGRIKVHYTVDGFFEPD